MVTSAYTRKFNDISACDIVAVGSKNAVLGEIYSKVSSRGPQIPNGFAITSFAFEHFLTANALHRPLFELMSQLDRKSYSNLQSIGARARSLILHGAMPYYLVVAIRNAYEQLCKEEGNSIDVAVRSSVAAESLPAMRFPGLHESILNIGDAESLLDAIKKCFASLYADSAIRYREDNHLIHSKLFFSVGVQKMAHRENGCWGTIVPLSNTGNMIDIKALQGAHKRSRSTNSSADHYLVSNLAISNGEAAIIKQCAGKNAGPDESKNTLQVKNRYVLTDHEITILSNWAATVNAHFGKPMEIEWIKDGKTAELYIIGASPKILSSSKKQYVNRKNNLPLETLGARVRQAVG